MLENLKELVRENVQDAVINNSEIPNEQNEAVIQAASGSIFDSLKEQLSAGNVGALVNIFKGGNAESSDITAQASNSFINKLSELGINSDTAKNVAGNIMPNIINKLTQKTNDPNDSSFDIKDILGKLAGGEDGKFELNDVIGMFTGGNDQNASGGILNKLKNMFN